MSRNAESRFALSPSNVSMRRSRFKLPHSRKTSFNIGEVTLVDLMEVLPGDTFDVQTNVVARLSTLITPVMDNIYLDTYYFFVPNRLVWDHWKEFMGENTASAWIPTSTYTMPQIQAPSGGWNACTIADDIGVRIGISNYAVSSLPFRGYALICNEWFRDENLMDPLSIPTDDTTVTGVNTDTFVTDVAKGGKRFLACKYHDYFTSCLPSPQKGPAVTIPVTTTTTSYGLSGNATGPVYPVANAHPSTLFTNKYQAYNYNGSSLGTMSGIFFKSNGTQDNFLASGGSGGAYPVINNLTADISDFSGVTLSGGTNVTVGTINELRLAFAMQKMYERDALGGSRYVEILKSHFGTSCPDYRLQRPEYLGGKRCPLNINQVIQQSASVSGQTPQGTTTAMSVTSDRHHDFKKSFTEHGYIYCLVVARYDHTYQQGTPKHLLRKDRFDFYDPIFANIGETAVYNKQIFTQGDSVVDADGNIIDDQVFGYQEAWAEYRALPNTVAGMMRSDYATPLDKWHLGDDYNTLPSLSASWIREDKTNVDRCLAVQSSVANQIIADFYFNDTATRVMPVYSVPGLIDHH